MSPADLRLGAQVPINIEEINMKHEWPADSEEHVWGPWMNRTRTTQYRKCVHPKCNAFETRETAKA